MASDVSTITLAGWSGLNTRDAEVALQPDETPDCLNVYFGRRGEVIRRPGWAAYTAAGALSGEGQQLWIHRAADAQDVMVAVDEDTGSLYKITPIDGNVTIARLKTSAAPTYPAMSTPTSGYGGGYPKGGVSFDGKFWVCDTSCAYVWDGTTSDTAVVAITDNTLSGNGTSGTPEFPKARSLITWKDRVVAGGVRYSGSFYGSRIHFSNVLEPWKWDSTDYIDIAPDRGGDIWAICNYGGSIIVFKEAAVYGLFGDGGPEDLTLSLISDEVGCRAPYSIVEMGGVLYWYDPIGDKVLVFDGQSITRIDDNIEGLIGATIRAQGYTRGMENRLHRGFAYEGRYYLSTWYCIDVSPWTKTQTGTFVYDSASGSWAKWDFSWNGAAELGGTVYAVGVEGGTDVARILGADLTDGGTDFSWHFETAWLPPVADRAPVDYRLHRLNAYYKGTTAVAPETSAISMVLRTDYSDGTDVRTISTSSAGTAHAVIADYSGLNSLWKSLKLRFSSDQQVAAELHGVTLVVEARPLTRGAAT